MSMLHKSGSDQEIYCWCHRIPRATMQAAWPGTALIGCKRVMCLHGLHGPQALASVKGSHEDPGAGVTGQEGRWDEAR